jgi:formate dehydrogenase iron-sulfur subunit
MTRIFVPKDAAALAVGADKVAARIVAEARAGSFG